MSGLRSHALPLPSEEDDNQRLRSYLLRCSSADIVAACRAVEAGLQQHQFQTGDHVRDFYRLCFPILLKKILGFEDSQLPSPQPSGRAATTASPVPSSNASAGGWLAHASLPGNEAQARELISLLSPHGTLFSSLLTADKESFVRYVFPTERLPEWVRNLLGAEKGVFLLGVISPLFKNRIMEDASGAVQVRLDVFEYYMFWFAYYAVCKETNIAQNGVRGARNPPASRSAQLFTHIEHWASSIPRLHQEKSQGSSTVRINPYLQLLQLYLSHFVTSPKPASSKWGLALGRGGQPDMSGSSTVSQGDILVHTLIEFWLVDDDPAPLPQKVRQSLGGMNGTLVVKPSLPIYVPPGNDLTDALKVFINYMNYRSYFSGAGPDGMYSTPGRDNGSRGRSGSRPSDPVLSSQSPLSAYSPSSFFSPKASSLYSARLQRPLYRFLLRAFQLWPMGSPVRRMMQVVEVWLEYIQPWNSTSEHRVLHTRSTPGRSKFSNQQSTPPSLLNWKVLDRNIQNGDHAGQCYVEDGKWDTYVSSNYLFYTQLVTHFLEFAIKNVHLDPEAILHMTYKVLAVLAQYKELMMLLKKIDTAFSSVSSGKAHHFTGLLSEDVTMIQEALENWEDWTVNSDQENGDVRSPSASGKFSMLRFFSLYENGGQQLLQALIVRGDAELQAATSEKVPAILQRLEAVREIAKKIFASYAPDSSYDFIQKLDLASPSNVDRSDQPVQPSGLNRHSWMDVKYRGDWMRRPIEAYEIAWLARLLVRLSDALNAALGLDGRQVASSYTPSAPPEPPAAEGGQGEEVELNLREERHTEMGLKEVEEIVRRRLGGMWLLLQRELQRRNWRVNLRFMAERQSHVLIVLVCFLCWILRAIARLIFVSSG